MADAIAAALALKPNLASQYDEIKLIKKPGQPKPNTAGVKADPVAIHIRQMFDGTRCSQCGDVRDHHGRCHHERVEDFNRQLEEILAWAEENESRANAFVVMASVRRLCLQSGLRDYPGQYGLTTVAEVSMKLRARFGIKPKYAEPKGSIADELPALGRE